MPLLCSRVGSDCVERVSQVLYTSDIVETLNALRKKPAETG